MNHLVKLFDPRSVLFAKHAQHVVLVHFPIALFLIAVVLDVASHWTRNDSLAATARINMIAAGILAIPTVITGLVAWQWQLEGQRLKGPLLFHLLFGSLSALLICIVASINFRQRKSVAPAPVYYVTLEFLTAAVVAATAHLGGFLSGVNSLS